MFEIHVWGDNVMFGGKGIKLVAGMLAAAVVLTILPTEVFTAKEDTAYMWDGMVDFTAGAHHAMEETVVLLETESEQLVSGVVEEKTPLVSEAEQNENMKRIATITSSRNLNLRKEASTSSRVLTTIPSGRRVIVLDETTPGWVKVEYKDNIGYVSAEYTSVVTEKFDAVAWEAEQTDFDTKQARLEAEAAERRKKAAAESAAKRKQKEKEAREKYVPPTGGTGQDVVNYAVQFVGYPYVLGGSSLTGGIDCSNFVMRVYEAFGVSLPHNSYALRSVGYEVSASEIQPGDIICYSGHVSIYIGNGQCVHAANKEDGIKISPKWNYTKVITIRRIF